MFKNKNIIITGASSGIGKEIAIKLSAEGAFCILIGRNKEKLLETQSKCPNLTKIICADLNKFDDYDRIVKDIYENCGSIYGFVHSAGIEQTIPLRVLSINNLREIFDINVFSAIQFIKLITKKKYIDTKQSIVLISSVMGVIGNKGLTSYSASKGALISMSKSLALELADKNVRVNVVSPGHVNDSNMSIEKEQKLNIEAINKIKLSHPLGLGKCEDVANLVSFLLDEKSKWITGQNYVIDGGYSIQ